MKNHMIIPIFVPHLGCPYDCVFCNQKKISGTAQEMNETDVRNQIETYLSTADGIAHVEIAFYGGSFTGIDMSLQKQFLDIASEYVLKHSLDGIRLSTRPDQINDDILTHLSQYPVIAIELGIQSMFEDVLAQSNRGHSVKDVYEASKLIRSYGFSLGHQMMLGLPGDTVEKSLATADKLIAIEPDMVRIYPTLVIKETELATLFEEGTYKPFDLETTIDLCVQLIERFELEGIDVLRVGLQPSDQIQPGKDVLAGPYHPALRQLVDEKRWVNYILQYIDKVYDNTQMTPITIKADSKLYQTIIGHKRGHVSLWSSHQPPIVIEQDPSVPEHTIQIDDTYHKAHAQVH